MSSPRYTIWIDTLCDGPVPSVLDVDGKPVLFATEEAAQREIVDLMMTRLQEFLDGHRDFEDAVTVDEYVVEECETGSGPLR